MGNIEIANQVSHFSDGNLSATHSGNISLGHMGCGLVSRLKPDKNTPAETAEEVTLFLNRHYGTKKVWGNSTDVILKLAKALFGLTQTCGQGLGLVDTMRNGSSSWRPGDLLRRAKEALYGLADHIGVEAPRIEYYRLDELCPTRQLLSEFRDDEQMTFDIYASRYQDELERDGAIGQAAGLAIRLNAMSLCPVFYCVDPYIKGFPNFAKQIAKPFRERDYPAFLREYGCHRVVLVELLTRFFLNHEIGIDLFEVDQHHSSGAHHRVLNHS